MPCRSTASIWLMLIQFGHSSTVNHPLYLPGLHPLLNHLPPIFMTKYAGARSPSLFHDRSRQRIGHTLSLPFYCLPIFDFCVVVFYYALPIITSPPQIFVTPLEFVCWSGLLIPSVQSKRIQLIISFFHHVERNFVQTYLCSNTQTQNKNTIFLKLFHLLKYKPFISGTISSYAEIFHGY